MSERDDRRAATKLCTLIAEDLLRERRPQQLRCDECGYARPLGVKQFAFNLSHGWPKHCGHTMKIEDA